LLCCSTGKSERVIGLTIDVHRKVGPDDPVVFYPVGAAAGLGLGATGAWLLRHRFL
jgi:hypothetical protein